MTREELCCFSRGFDHGNYAAAYEGVVTAEAWISGLDLNGLIRESLHSLPLKPGDLSKLQKALIAGLVLGVYSSYERHEIPPSERELFDHVLLWAYETGMPEHRDWEPEEIASAARERGMPVPKRLRGAEPGSASAEWGEGVDW